MNASHLFRSSLLLCGLQLTAACAEGTSSMPNLYAGPSAGAGHAGDSGAGAAGGGGTAAQPNLGAAGAAGMDQAGAGGDNAEAYEIQLPLFSFFVTSYAAMQRLANDPNGFGGDLRFGKADGLAGADEICRQIAEASMATSSKKGWRAFLSVTRDAQSKPVHAIDRVGEGPWYDRLGLLVAANKDDLVQPRPRGADPRIIDDLPNEDGIPNRYPDGLDKPGFDNHRILTGTGADGRLFSDDASVTCRDWTSAVGADGQPRVGHSFPRMGADTAQLPVTGGQGNWISALDAKGCAPGVSLDYRAAPDQELPTVGSGGGYGGIYCFALTP